MADISKAERPPRRGGLSDNSPVF